MRSTCAHATPPSVVFRRFPFAAVGSLHAFSVNGTALFRAATAWADVLSPATVSQGPTQCALRPKFVGVFIATVLAPLLCSAAAILVLCISVVVKSVQKGSDRKWHFRLRQTWNTTMRQQQAYLTIMTFICQLS